MYNTELAIIRNTTTRVTAHLLEISFTRKLSYSIKYCDQLLEKIGIGCFPALTEN